jgi:hypothetical protein
MRSTTKTPYSQLNPEDFHVLKDHRISILDSILYTISAIITALKGHHTSIQDTVLCTKHPCNNKALKGRNITNHATITHETVSAHSLQH